MIFRYIEEQTEKLLKDIGIDSAPIDPIKCAKHLKVDVQKTPLGDDISGLFVIKDNMAFIRVNSDEKNRPRQRFTIAHELGHYVLHKNVQFILDKSYEQVMYRDSFSSTGEIHREREANSFAASLLMPRFLIEQEIVKVTNKNKIIEELASIFQVSKEAMYFRLTNLGFIDYGIF